MSISVQCLVYDNEGDDKDNCHGGEGQDEDKDDVVLEGLASSDWAMH